MNNVIKTTILALSLVSSLQAHASDEQNCINQINEALQINGSGELVMEGRLVGGDNNVICKLSIKTTDDNSVLNFSQEARNYANPNQSTLVRGTNFSIFINTEENKSYVMSIRKCNVGQNIDVKTTITNKNRSIFSPSRYLDSELKIERGDGGQIYRVSARSETPFNTGGMTVCEFPVLEEAAVLTE